LDGSLKIAIDPRSFSLIQYDLSELLSGEPVSIIPWSLLDLHAKKFVSS